MRFSQRIGKKPIKAVLQVQSIDDELRAALWNCLQVCLFEGFQGPSQTEVLFAHMGEASLQAHFALGNLQGLFRALWANYFKWPLDSLPNNYASALQEVRERFFKSQWYEVYDMVEFIAQAVAPPDSSNFVLCCNKTLERELSGYRFINNQIAPITNETEIQEIEEALGTSRKTMLSGVHAHLEMAVSKLSDRKSPDYRNSIKESVSAVEAVVQLISKKPNASLGDALKSIEDAVGLHPALKRGFLAIYGYTSDADGIRHAMIEESKCDFEDAKYMLVSCSAFVNYLILKAAKAGIRI